MSELNKKNTDIKIYWSENFIPYESRSEEESSELLLGKHGEGCDANTEITRIITIRYSSIVTHRK